MLTTVDLAKIDAGETNYLFTVVALHTYAFYSPQQVLFGATEKPASQDDNDRTLFGQAPNKTRHHYARL
jgi:hypothetical protein